MFLGVGKSAKPRFLLPSLALSQWADDDSVSAATASAFFRDIGLTEILRSERSRIPRVKKRVRLVSECSPTDGFGLPANTERVHVSEMIERIGAVVIGADVGVTSNGVVSSVTMVQGTE